jgi:hypothetical protein
MYTHVSETIKEEKNSIGKLRLRRSCGDGCAWGLRFCQHCRGGLHWGKGEGGHWAQAIGKAGK